MVDSRVVVAERSLCPQASLMANCQAPRRPWKASHIIFLSREGRDLGVAFQAPPGSQASSRGEAKDSALLSTVKGDQGSIRTSKPALRGSEDPYSSNYLWSMLPKTRQLCRRQTPTSETELDLAAHRCCLPTWGLDRKSLKFPEPRGIVMSVSQNRWKHGMSN